MLGFRAFSTNRHFDDSTQTPWASAGERLAGLFPHLGIPSPRQMVFAGQVHGAVVSDVAGATAASDVLARCDDCDGLVAVGAGVWLVIRTADCLPIALADAEAGVVAALHAGWKGTFAGIMEAGIDAMVGRGADPHRIQIWIGPCISGDVYEVSPELAESFREKFSVHQGFLRGRHLDLSALNRSIAIARGVAPGRIYSSSLCTWRDAEVLHSHRRQGQQRGHQFLVCGLTDPHNHPATRPEATRD